MDKNLKFCFQVGTVLFLYILYISILHQISHRFIKTNDYYCVQIKQVYSPSVSILSDEGIGWIKKKKIYVIVLSAYLFVPPLGQIKPIGQCIGNKPRS